MKTSRITFCILLAAALAGFGGCGGGGKAGIGGTLSGLNTGQSVTLANNGSDSLTVGANGSYQFASQLDSGVAYNVTVLSQPTGEQCDVANATGSVDSKGDSVTNVAIACVTASSVGGTVSGLATGTAVTLTDGVVLLPVAANGPFAFPGVAAAGTSYDVTVATPPLGQTCVVTNGTGNVSATSQSAITVTCS